VPIPESVIFKIVRANTHFEEFKTEVFRYYGTNKPKILGEVKGDPKEFLGKAVHLPIPRRIPLIAGDCIQNLRSALDYLVWELVIAAKNKPGEHTQFPICSSPESFKGQKTGRRGRPGVLAGICGEAITEIEGLQPYPDRQEAVFSTLSAINYLCNVNKHRHILTVSMPTGRIPADAKIAFINGEFLINADLDSVQYDTEIGPLSFFEGDRGPGFKMDVGLNLLAFVAFNDGPARNLEASGALAAMFKAVCEDILPRFERFF
jgi:hypothetical protein